MIFEPRSCQDSWSALHKAAYVGDLSKIKRLVDNGAKVNREDSQGYTPLHCASYGGLHEAVQLLLRHRANARALAHHGQTVLHAWYVEYEEGDTMPLHNAGYHVEVPDGHMSEIDHAKTVRMLVEAGAQIKSADVCGNTPLHAALLAEYRPRSLALIDEMVRDKVDGPLIRLRLNDFSATVLDIAFCNDDWTVIAHLLRAGCTPMHASVVMEYLHSRERVDKVFERYPVLLKHCSRPMYDLLEENREIKRELQEWRAMPANLQEAVVGFAGCVQEEHLT
jgi:ankyrin repeat protein